MHAGKKGSSSPGRLLLFLAALALPGLVFAQRSVTPPPSFVPPGPQAPGKQLGNDCQLTEMPRISLSLSSPTVCPGLQQTLTWEVRDPRPGVAWGYPVHIRVPAGVPLAIPDPAPSSGSRAFTATAGVLRAGLPFTITLTTRCGSKTAAFQVVDPPSLGELHAEFSKPVNSGRPGSSVRLVGNGLGDLRGGVFFRPSAFIPAKALEIHSWSNTEIRAKLPNYSALENFEYIDGSILMQATGPPSCVSNTLSIRILRDFCWPRPCPRTRTPTPTPWR